MSSYVVIMRGFRKKLMDFIHFYLPVNGQSINVLNLHPKRLYRVSRSVGHRTMYISCHFTPPERYSLAALIDA